MQKNSKKRLVLEAGRTERHYWNDIFHYRDLFFILARRDIKVRYKQTAIGVLWAIIRPLLTMMVFSFVFGRIANLPSEGVPYALLVFTAMVPWFFFASSVTESSGSLIANSNLISKVYFPRILVPSSTVLVAAVDFMIAMILLLTVMVFFNYMPTWRVVFIPYFLFIAFSAALGLGLLFSALNIRYRDFQFIVPFMIQIGMYASPVGFISSVIPEKWILVYALNPMVGVIDGFRWAILGETFELRWDVQFLAAGMAISLLFLGIISFRRFERGIADVI